MAYSNKDQERQDLLRFLSARRSATGEELILLIDHEAPDFICERANKSLVGVEHTRIEYDPEQTELRRAYDEYDGDIDNFAIMWAAFIRLAEKETKRRKPHWKLPNATILVFDLAEGYRFESWPEDDRLSVDYSDSGFIEVWISDHSSIEAYGEVTAIGLYPKSIWGIRGQDYLWGIPYK